MGSLINIEDTFEHIYLVDLSSSLCDIAKARFQRLGWKNVSVICEDARTFTLPRPGTFGLEGVSEKRDHADIVSMSYSLSMIPGTATTRSWKEEKQLTGVPRLLQRH